MNYVIRELTLYRHFLLIDSPIPFEFIANPTNYNKDMSDFSRVTGLDVCSRPSGCWRVDCWRLLPKEFQRNNPVFTMLLKYDADLLGEGEAVDVRYSDIDVGEGVAGVNGQLVQILPSTFRPVVNAVDSLRELNSDGFDSLGRSIGNADVNNVNGCNAIMDSVNALQTSNHADLSAVKSSVDSIKSNLFSIEDVRRVFSPVAVGFAPTWYIIKTLPWEDDWCVYTSVSMPLQVVFYTNGVKQAERHAFFKAGISTFRFFYADGNFIVTGIEGEGVIHRFEWKNPFVPGVQAILYHHSIKG